jgi:hypothetical protein
MFTNSSLSLLPDNNYDWKPRLRFFEVPSWHGSDVVPVVHDDIETLLIVAHWFPSCKELSQTQAVARVEAGSTCWYPCAATLSVEVDLHELAIDAADDLAAISGNRSFAEWRDELNDEQTEWLAVQALEREELSRLYSSNNRDAGVAV